MFELPFELVFRLEAKEENQLERWIGLAFCSVELLPYMRLTGVRFSRKNKGSKGERPSERPRIICATSPRTLLALFACFSLDRDEGWH